MEHKVCSRRTVLSVFDAQRDEVLLQRLRKNLKKKIFCPAKKIESHAEFIIDSLHLDGCVSLFRLSAAPLFFSHNASLALVCARTLFY